MSTDKPAASKHSSPHAARGMRVHDRYAWPAKVQVCWVFASAATEAGEASEAQTLDCVDLGLGGIGIVSVEAVPVGTTGAVLLLCGNDCGRMRGLEVVHARFDPSLGAHVLGGKWLAALPGAARFFVKRTKTGPLLARCGEPDDPPRDRQAA